MSQGDITRLNQMYKCPVIKPKSSNQTTQPHVKDISETPNDYNHQQIQSQPQQHPRPFENAFNPFQNIENQLGQQTRPNERQFEQKQFLEVQPQFGIPFIHQSARYTKTPLNLPGIESQPSQYQPQQSQYISNQPVQQLPSETEVKNTKPNEIPNATEDNKSNKPCGPNIFMTFLFKISQKQ